MRTLRDFHAAWAYVAIAVNGVVGIAALVAWRVPRLRGRWLWVCTIVAEAALLLQVAIGVILVSSKDYTAPKFHIFYGILVFVTIGFAYSYRSQMRGLEVVESSSMGASGCFSWGSASERSCR